MCGRFYINPDDMSDEELIALLDREKAQLDASVKSNGPFEVRPGDKAAVIAMNRKLQRSAFRMGWGFRLEKRLIFNARSETAESRAMFRQSVTDRRCLIPASGYFEWDHRQKPYQKLRFQNPGQKIIYLAGLYRFEPENRQPVFTILTREAAPDISCFHDRMPVIIPTDLTDAWLNRSQSYESLLKYADLHLAWQAEA